MRIRIAVLSLSLLLGPLAGPAALSAQNQRQQAAPQQQQQAPLQGTQWREPRGRFSITIPAGWHIDDSQPSMKITNGTSWAIFDTTSLAGGPLAAAQKEANQMQPMVSNWKVVSQGDYTTPTNHPAAGVTVTCDVPTRQGKEARVMLFTAMGAGNDNYVTMTSSVDQPTGQEANNTLVQIFHSIQF